MPEPTFIGRPAKALPGLHGGARFFAKTAEAGSGKKVWSPAAIFASFTPAVRPTLLDETESAGRRDGIALSDGDLREKPINGQGVVPDGRRPSRDPLAFLHGRHSVARLMGPGSRPGRLRISGQLRHPTPFSRRSSIGEGTGGADRATLQLSSRRSDAVQRRLRIACRPGLLRLRLTTTDVDDQTSPQGPRESEGTKQSTRQAPCRLVDCFTRLRRFAMTAERPSLHPEGSARQPV